MNNIVDGLLQQLSQHGNEPAPAEARDEFHRIAQTAPPEALSQGLQEAFESDRTPPFGQMVAQLFGHSDDQQKRGMLGALLGGLGGAAQPVLAQAGVDAQPEHAPQLSGGQVQQIAEQAQKADPGIVGQMSQFYAQHPVLVKSLGGMAMALVLGRMHSPRR